MTQYDIALTRENAIEALEMLVKSANNGVLNEEYTIPWRNWHIPQHGPREHRDIDKSFFLPHEIERGSIKYDDDLSRIVLEFEGKVDNDSHPYESASLTILTKSMRLAILSYYNGSTRIFNMNYIGEGQNPDEKTYKIMDRIYEALAEISQTMREQVHEFKGTA